VRTLKVSFLSLSIVIFFLVLFSVTHSAKRTMTTQDLLNHCSFSTISWWKGRWYMITYIVVFFLLL
jgi:hypothetical protein